MNYDDEFNNDSKLIEQILQVPQVKKSREEIYEETKSRDEPRGMTDEIRGLSRTRSSQDLKDLRDRSDDERNISPETEYVNKEFIDNKGLNDISMEEG